MQFALLHCCRGIGWLPESSLRAGAGCWQGRLALAPTGLVWSAGATATAGQAGRQGAGCSAGEPGWLPGQCALSPQGCACLPAVSRASTHLGTTSLSPKEPFKPSLLASCAWHKLLQRQGGKRGASSLFLLTRGATKPRGWGGGGFDLRQQGCGGSLLSASCMCMPWHGRQA